eukprot:1591627-Amphidinium_carterae.2
MFGYCLVEISLVCSIIAILVNRPCEVRGCCSGAQLSRSLFLLCALGLYLPGISQSCSPYDELQGVRHPTLANKKLRMWVVLTRMCACMHARALHHSGSPPLVPFFRQEAS